MTQEADAHTDSVGFTVVIPTHHGRQSVLRAVQSVLGQSHDALELIVVSDGEGGRTREILHGITDPRMRVIEQERLGVSGARNRGAAAGTHPWVAFLDDDDEYRPDALESWSSVVDRETVVVTAPVIFWSGTIPVETVECHLSMTDPSMRASRIHPGGFAVRRDVFMAVGGFDEHLRYSENLDLGLRLCELIASGDTGAVAYSSHVAADLHRQAATQRIRRYDSAPADSARVFLDRYAGRLAHDRAGAASLHRIISRQARTIADTRQSIRHAGSAIRIQPTNVHNYRSLLLAVLGTRPRS